MGEGVGQGIAAWGAHAPIRSIGGLRCANSRCTCYQQAKGCVDHPICFKLCTGRGWGGEDVRNLLSAVGSYASLVGLYYTVRPSGSFTLLEQVLLLFSVSLAGIHLFFEIMAMRNSMPQTLRSDLDIKNYMERFTHTHGHSGGRTSILARDMSWVDPEMEQLLTELAQNRNLTLFMESPNFLSNKLRSQGADIIYYHEAGLAPSTRFAITNEGRADAQVSIGLKNKKGHLEVQEYSREHTIFYLCSDIVKALRAFKQR
ncbi:MULTISPECIES: hypothetical protein [unclassified Bradyrhizobium]|uniref:hypothetical protein n=1 Tax=unclassified Bradyrhizobium TaxID=2631580 RepID=UPI002916652F|nr:MULTISPECIES: hypothetical protein [unclassified Bradyrhizobium]